MTGRGYTYVEPWPGLSKAEQPILQFDARVIVSLIAILNAEDSLLGRTWNVQPKKRVKENGRFISRKEN